MLHQFEKATLARVKRCLLECEILDDLAAVLADIDASDMTADTDEVLRRRADIEYVMDWLQDEAPT